MNAPLVLLLHGSAASGAQWKTLAAALSPRCQVHAPDLQGYGMTPAPRADATHSVASEAAPLLRWLRAAGRPVHVVAHSYGGAVALQMARERPGDIASLLLYEPAAFHLLRDGNGADAEALAEIREVGDTICNAAAVGPAALGAASFVDYWNGAGSWVAMPAGRQESVVRAVPKLALEFTALFHEPSGIDALRALRMPRLLVQGDRSPRAALRVAARVSAAWPDAGLVVVPGAGHMGPVTHREAFQAIVERHLRQAAALPA